MATLVVGPTGTYNDLEDAIAAANSGDTIQLQAGVIPLEDPVGIGPLDAVENGDPGHVVINKNLTIIGAGQNLSTIQNVNDNPNAQNEALDQPRELAAAILVAGATVSFSRFTLDGGDGPDAGGLDLGSGIYFDAGASGAVDDVTIRNLGADVAAQPVGTGIRIEEGGDLTVASSRFEDLERIGIAAFDGGTVVDVTGGNFVGQGENDDTINYGIFAGFGGTVTVRGSNFTGFAGTIQANRDLDGDGDNDAFTSAGILVFDATATVDNATFTDNYNGIAAAFAVLGIGNNNTFSSNVANPPNTDPVAGLNIFDSIVTGTENVEGPGSNIILDGRPVSETIRGGPQGDNLFGDAGNDTIRGNAGNDLLDGSSGTDTVVFSGKINEYRFEQTGADEFVITDLNPANGNDGSDTVRNFEFYRFADAEVDESGFPPPNVGTPGNDRLVGTPGNDSLNGQEGNDVVLGLGGNDHLVGCPGDDYVAGGDGNDTLIGCEGNDSLNGEAGDDYIDGQQGNDGLFGGSGNDSINGSEGDDYLVGGGGNDSYFGGDGADSLNGGDGVDYMIGGAGNDGLFGGVGNDTLNGGTGQDWLVSGNGADIFLFQAGFGLDTVVDFDARTDVVNLHDVGSFTFADVMARASQQGSNTVIDFGGGNVIIMKDIQRSTLAPDDFNL